MSTEALYYQQLKTISQFSDRVYPIKLPQNATYPAVIYNVETDIEARLGAESVEGSYAFENTFYASSYSDIIAITESFRDMAIANSWNIQGYMDLEYVVDKSVYARVLLISATGKV